jgi:FkbM family methyltransferase
MNFRARKYMGYGVDELVYQNYFGPTENGFFIECGAGSGDSCRFWEEEFNWQGLYIEASPTMYEQIKDRRNAYNIGLGPKRQIAEFTDIVSAPGGGVDNGSFCHTEEHIRILEGYNCVFEKVPVQMLPYHELLKIFKIPSVDLFVLDVEGYEIEVMKGMVGAPLPSVMVIEYPIAGFDNVVEMATGLGLSFNFVSGNNAYFTSLPTIECDWWGKTGRVSDL